AVYTAAARGYPTGGRILLRELPPPHVGLGSSTTVTLGALRALSLSNGWGCSEHDLVLMSGRGRTSGVGSQSFFHGGLAIDCGQSGHPEGGRYRPSHS